MVHTEVALLARRADNILIDSDDTAYVTDFGLSKAKVLTMMNPTGGPTLAGRVPMAAAGGGAANSRAKYRSFVEFSEIAGTPSYLAPELWRNEVSESRRATVRE